MLNFYNVLYGEGPLFILICKFYILSAPYLMALSVNIIQYHNTNLNRIQYHNPWRVLWSDKGNDCCFSSLNRFLSQGNRQNMSCSYSLFICNQCTTFGKPCLAKLLLNREPEDIMLVSLCSSLIWSITGWVPLTKAADVMSTLFWCNRPKTDGFLKPFHSINVIWYTYKTFCWFLFTLFASNSKI